MFRMNIPQIDPAEERKLVRESVKKNVMAFMTLVCLIRIAPYLLEAVGK